MNSSVSVCRTGRPTEKINETGCSNEDVYKRQLQEDVPWIRCYDSENIVAVTSDVEGFSPVRLGIDIFSMSWKQ